MLRKRFAGNDLPETTQPSNYMAYTTKRQGSASDEMSGEFLEIFEVFLPRFGGSASTVLSRL